MNSIIVIQERSRHQIGAKSIIVPISLAAPLKMIRAVADARSFRLGNVARPASIG